MKASCGAHGLATLFPRRLATLPLNIFHVEGMNCAGPIAPPQPDGLPLMYAGIQQDTLVFSGSLIPSSFNISMNGGTSRVGCMVRGFAAPVETLTPSPVVKSLR